MGNVVYPLLRHCLFPIPLNYFQDPEEVDTVSSDTQGDIAQYKPEDFIS